MGALAVTRGRSPARRSRPCCPLAASSSSQGLACALATCSSACSERLAPARKPPSRSRHHSTSLDLLDPPLSDQLASYDPQGRQPRCPSVYSLESRRWIKLRSTAPSSSAGDPTWLVRWSSSCFCSSPTSSCRGVRAGLHDPWWYVPALAVRPGSKNLGPTRSSSSLALRSANDKACALPAYVHSISAICTSTSSSQGRRACSASSSRSTRWRASCAPSPPRSSLRLTVAPR